ncbi:hypothetical protein ASD60_18765 [Pseudomonas sp. Root562]|nr:hypothetical protein ASD60_18765 [Pseudomonas sp. Root562]
MLNAFKHGVQFCTSTPEYELSTSKASQLCGDDNMITIKRADTMNIAYVTQGGTGNIASVDRSGMTQTATVQQFGSANQATVLQQ